MQPEIRCVELVDEVANWMDAALSAERRSMIEQHLSVCPHCTRYLDQTQAAITALRLSEPVATRVVLRDAVRAALRERKTWQLRPD